MRKKTPGTLVIRLTGVRTLTCLAIRIVIHHLALLR